MALIGVWRLYTHSEVVGGVAASAVTAAVALGVEAEAVAVAAAEADRDVALGASKLHLELVAVCSPLQFLQIGFWWLQSFPVVMQSLQPAWSFE